MQGLHTVTVLFKESKGVVEMVLYINAEFPYRNGLI